MKTIADLLELVRSGSKPVVVFKKGVIEKEDYAEPGMRARVLSATAPDGDDVLEIMFDFGEFEDFNRPLEVANYYDKDGKPSQTAREAGFYKPQDRYFYGLNDPLADELEVVPTASLAMFEEFKALNSTDSYVEWLEKQVLVSRIQ